MIETRPGTIADLAAVMNLMDEAVAWLVAQGRSGQWGSEPLSGQERFVEHMRAEIETNDLWIAEIDGRVVGAMLLGEEPMPYVAGVSEPELYLHLLVTTRQPSGQGVGRALIAKARSEAAERDIDLIRVDCYGGDDRKLVMAYERLGFTPTEPFLVKEWPGQILAMRLSGNMSKSDI